MKRLFGRRIQQMTKCSCYVLIFGLFVSLSPKAVWAYSCGPTELSVNKGDSVEYVITGPATADFEVVDTGNSLVATIEPLKIRGERLGKFDVTGVKDGNTAFKIFWLRPQGKGTCPVSVTVSE